MTVIKVKNWAVYQNQLEQFLTANEIKDAVRRKPSINISVWISVYSVAEFSESSKSGRCRCDIWYSYVSNTSGFADRYKFYNASKLASETINEWAVRVSALAVHCEFDVYLETAIRDKFVMGKARDKVKIKK